MNEHEKTLARRRRATCILTRLRLKPVGKLAADDTLKCISEVLAYQEMPDWAEYLTVTVKVPVGLLVPVMEGIFPPVVEEGDGPPVPTYTWTPKGGKTP